MKAALILLALVAGCMAEIYFQDTFSDGEGWTKRWIQSDVKKAEQGALKLSAGTFYGDAEDDKGLMTSQDARFYIYSAEFPEFSNKGKTLYIQYQIKHPQSIDCGGGYVKLMPKDAATAATFSPDTKYNVMFGPDVCGTSTRKTHVIFGDAAGKNHLVSKDIRCETDELSHLYTLIIRPDNTYEVQIDGTKVESGNMEEDFDLVAPKEIPDPAAKKPEDWVDEPEMDDPTDKKPDDYDSIPARIPDPAAKKPEDWDDETDGEWEAPTIDNPEYKGPWSAKRIPNPAYKGAWVHPKIANPEYKANPELYAYQSFGRIGIEIWQVKSGSIFDNFLITDDEAVVAEWAKKFETRKAAEKVMKEKVDEDKRKAEEAAKPAEPAKPEEVADEKEEL